MRLHFSTGCYDCRGTTRLRQSIHFNRIQVLFADHTTNSRSSGLRVDAGRHQFSEGEKNVVLSCSFNCNTLLASFHPQILERWGCADEVHLCKYIRAKDFGPEF